MRIDSIIGTGLVTPLRRVGGDFLYASGEELLDSVVRNILEARQGDLRWRPNFGMRAHRRRHSRITAGLIGALQADAIRALSADPRIEVVRVDAEQLNEPSTAVLVRVTWRPVAVGNSRSVVLSDERQTEVRI